MILNEAHQFHNNWFNQNEMTHVNINGKNTGDYFYKKKLLSNKDKEVIPNKVNNIFITSAKTRDTQEQSKNMDYKVKDLRWLTIVYLTVSHLNCVYDLIAFPYFQKNSTFIFSKYIFVKFHSCLFSLYFFILLDYIYGGFGGVGLIIGVHRYWSHKSFKANFLLRIILLLAYS